MKFEIGKWTDCKTNIKIPVIVDCCGTASPNKINLPEASHKWEQTMGDRQWRKDIVWPAKISASNTL